MGISIGLHEIEKKYKTGILVSNHNNPAKIRTVVILYDHTGHKEKVSLSGGILYEVYFFNLLQLQLIQDYLRNHRLSKRSWF